MNKPFSPKDNIELGHKVISIFIELMVESIKTKNPALLYDEALLSMVYEKLAPNTPEDAYRMGIIAYSVYESTPYLLEKTLDSINKNKKE